MVQAIIDIDDKTNRVLNIVKAKLGLKDKSQAITVVVNEYEQNILEPPLRPEYIEKAKKIMKEKKIHIGSIENFRKRYGIK